MANDLGGGDLSGGTIRGEHLPRQVPGSACVSHAGFGVPPRQASLGSAASKISITRRKVRDCEDALTSRRDARATRVIGNRFGHVECGIFAALATGRVRVTVATGHVVGAQFGLDGCLPTNHTNHAKRNQTLRTISRPFACFVGRFLH